MAFHDFSPKTAATHRRLDEMLLHCRLQAFVDAALFGAELMRGMDLLKSAETLAIQLRKNLRHFRPSLSWAGAGLT
jgi:hypothetical protein